MKIQISEIADKVKILENHPSDNFLELVMALGFDKGKDFIGADLRGMDFRDLDLNGFDFSYADFRGAILAGANLYNAKLTGAIFDKAPFHSRREDHIVDSKSEIPEAARHLLRQALEATDGRARLSANLSLCNEFPNNEQISRFVRKRATQDDAFFVRDKLCRHLGSLSDSPKGARIDLMKATVAELSGRDNLKGTVRELIRASGSSQETKKFLLAFAHVKSEIIGELVAFYRDDNDVIDITKVIARWADREERRIHALVALIEHALGIAGVKELMLEIATTDESSWTRFRVIRALLETDKLTPEDAEAIVRANAEADESVSDVVSECAAAFLPDNDGYLTGLIAAVRNGTHPAQEGALRGLIRRYDKQLYEILFKRYRYHLDLSKPISGWTVQSIAHAADVEGQDLIRRIQDFAKHGLSISVKAEP
jgi:Pentapeptide repeats (8 copies)